jgi:hypothetical protein
LKDPALAAIFMQLYIFNFMYPQAYAKVQFKKIFASGATEMVPLIFETMAPSSADCMVIKTSSDLSLSLLPRFHHNKKIVVDARD